MRFGYHEKAFGKVRFSRVWDLNWDRGSIFGGLRWLGSGVLFGLPLSLFRPGFIISSEETQASMSFSLHSNKCYSVFNTMWLDMKNKNKNKNKHPPYIGAFNLGFGVVKAAHLMWMAYIPAS